MQSRPKKLPYVPVEAEIRNYCTTVWATRRTGDIVLIKTLLHTGVRVAEPARIRIDDVDLDACRIRITHGKGGKDRTVLFPAHVKETLALHVAAARKKGAAFLFTWLKSQGIDDALIQPYSGHAGRTSLKIYSKIALGPAQKTRDGVIDRFPV
ncbi:tyrosine-type recombinase/integrase [Streptosporangium canum]|uniref:tyrosine-type recombinase/integrase n=1 Tax=Streptosporangium canum TaxID=324952 RepID=UPI00344A04A9